MIVRIVHMFFRPHALEQLMPLIHRQLRNVMSHPGCLAVKLFRDTSDPDHLCTFSIWEDQEALDDYRQSDHFIEVWSTLKSHFAKPPQAYSFKDRTP